jgi:AraC family transcriptional regulator of adaptative response / DNA-3-methyladenine glycosylase II
MTLDPEICWRAWTSRDRRFDGRFFMGVTSTGIYCRPGCPARIPARRNVGFYASAAAAEAAGFRPCLRCRPETARGSAAALGTSATVARALRLIEDGRLDDGSVERLADRLGVTSRWLRQLFHEQVGASPLEVAMTRRVHFARRLLDETAMPLAGIALASGFAGERRLRAAIQRTFRRAPSALRGRPAPASAPLALRAAARAPFDAAPLLAFLAVRAIPGVEQVDGRTYRRTVSLAGEAAVLAVEAPPRECGVRVSLAPAPPAALLPALARVSRLFDLDADATAIAAHLSTDPLLRGVLPRGGVRVPGAWDAFEVVVRAMLGQQVSVAAARTMAGRIVRACGVPLTSSSGGLTHLFPEPAALAAAPLESLGLTRARAAALRGVSANVAAGALDLDGFADLEDAVARLVREPGIGAWTAQYVALRALHEPDAFPAGDLGVRRALARDGVLPPERAVLAHAERWRPWRAYATVALWSHHAAPGRPGEKR